MCTLTLASNLLYVAMAILSEYDVLTVDIALRPGSSCLPMSVLKRMPLVRRPQRLQSQPIAAQLIASGAATGKKECRCLLQSLRQIWSVLACMMRVSLHCSWAHCAEYFPRAGIWDPMASEGPAAGICPGP